MEEVRAQFHRAAVAYEEAAVVRLDEGQPEAYWRSAQCYLAAEDFSRAGAVLNKFVQLTKNEARQAEGYLSMAEAYESLGEKEKARQAYYKCIEFPLTPFAYQARYKLALEEKEKKNYKQGARSSSKTWVRPRVPFSIAAPTRNPSMRWRQFAFLPRISIKRRFTTRKPPASTPIMPAS